MSIEERWATDRLLSSQCNHCAQWIHDRTCHAFPGGIPEDILFNRHDHREPYPDAENPTDRGVRFEMLPGHVYEYRPWPPRKTTEELVAESVAKYGE